MQVLDQSLQNYQSLAAKVDIKIKLAMLWISMMILYIYNDFFTLFTPDAINDMIAGRMGPFEVTQTALVAATVLMIIPIAVIIITLLVSSKLSRVINIVLGSLYLVVNISNIPGSWMFYVLSGVVQIVIAATIIWLSVKWPNEDHN